MAREEAKPPARIAYLYSRVSSRGQKQGRGLATQQENGEALCSRKGWKVDKSVKLVDDGRSAFTHKHLLGKLGRFFEMVKEGDIRPGSVLVIDQLDRLSRADIRKAVNLFGEILDAGIWIATVDPEAVYERLDEVNVWSVVAEFMRANSESRQKRRRQSQAWVAKRREAKTGGAIVVPNYPKWLKQKRKASTRGDRKWDAVGWEEVPQYVASVKRMFDLALEGHGAAVIGATLNQEKAAFWGNHWGQRIVYTTLTGRQVLGEWQPTTRPDGREGKRVKEGDPVKAYPAIIEEDVWLRVQAAIQGRRGKARGPAVRNRSLFSGLLADALNPGCSFFVTEYQNGDDKVLMAKSMVFKTRTKMARGTVPAVEYDRLEHMLMHMIQVMPRATKDNTAADRLAVVSANLAARIKRLDMLSAQFADVSSNETPEFMLTTMKKLNGMIEADREEVQSLRMRLASRDEEAVGRLRSMWSVEYLDRPKGAERETYRRKCRTLLQEIITRIHVAVDIGEDKVARHPVRSLLVEVHYANGRVQQGWSPPGVYIVQEDHEDEDGTGYRDRPYWDDRVFAWAVAEPKSEQDTPPPVIRMPKPTESETPPAAAPVAEQESEGEDEGGEDDPYLDYLDNRTPEEAEQDIEDELAEYAAWEIDRPSYVPRLAKGITAEKLAAVVAKLVAQTEQDDQEREERAKREAAEMEEAEKRGDPDAIPPWER